MRYEMDGYLMCGDRRIARIENGLLIDTDNVRLPFYLRRCNDLYGWLENRAVDRHRTHSRLLKRMLRLSSAEDPDVSMAVHAATITDNFWVKRDGENLTYEQIRFKQNPLADTALFGSLQSFSDGRWKDARRSPEFTNTGSFEKCWRRENGSWWLYKNGDIDGFYAELFIEQIGRVLGLSMAHYEMAEDGKYIRSKDITDDASVNLDHASGLIGGAYDDYELNYNIFKNISSEIAASYVNMLYLDALCFNADRHENNYGLLRSAETGEVLQFAPLFDHNIALFSKDAAPFTSHSSTDMLMLDFCAFIENQEIPFCQPILSRVKIEEIAKSIPISYDTAAVKTFIFDRQNQLAQRLSKFPHYSIRQVSDTSPLASLMQGAAARTHITNTLPAKGKDGLGI